MNRQVRVAVIDAGSLASLFLEAQAAARGGFIIVAYHRRLLPVDVGVIAAHRPDLLIVDGKLTPESSALKARLSALTPVVELACRVVAVAEASPRALVTTGSKGGAVQPSRRHPSGGKERAFSWTVVCPSCGATGLAKAIFAAVGSDLRDTEIEAIEVSVGAASVAGLEAKKKAQISTREQEIADLIGTHRLSNREIAERLYISENTVESHIRHILSKLDLKSRYQLVIKESDRNERTVVLIEKSRNP